MKRSRLSGWALVGVYRSGRASIPTASVTLPIQLLQSHFIFVCLIPAAAMGFYRSVFLLQFRFTPHKIQLPLATAPAPTASTFLLLHDIMYLLFEDVDD